MGSFFFARKTSNICKSIWGVTNLAWCKITKFECFSRFLHLENAIERYNHFLCRHYSCHYDVFLRLFMDFILKSDQNCDFFD
eukprot:TRINITY_DN900_c0_g1_i1.p1 TRINITY_DN900_c0_g1~~TRINITY_DN900_c0_g1_i1.p1  ORF type:complete len:93 (+),score=4.44 TRINITY_DN900_c0_g1_i1:36-281(+)